MKTILKLLLYGLGGIAIAMLLLFASLPSIVSTDWGRERFLETVNQGIPGSIAMQDLSAGWRSGLSFKNFELLDPQGKSVISIQSFESESPLWGLLSNGTVVGEMQVQKLNMNLKKHDNGTTNLDQALGARVLDLQINPRSDLKMKEMNLIAKIPAKGDSLVIESEGETLVGTKTGSFNVQAVLSDFKKESFRKWNRMDLKANVTQFPVAIIDALFSLQRPSMAGVIRTLVGETIDLNLEETFSRDEIRFLFNAKSMGFTSNVDLKLPKEAESTGSASSIAAKFELLLSESLKTPLGDVQLQSVFATIEGAEGSDEIKISIDSKVMTQADPIHFHLESALEKEKLFKFDDPFPLKATLSLKGNQIDIPELKVKMKSLNKGTIHADKIVYKDQPFHGIQIPWEFSPLKDHIQFKIEANTPENEGTIAGNYTITHLFHRSEPTKSEGVINAKHIPSKLFNILDESMDEILGELINVNIKFNLQHYRETKGTIDIGFKGDDIEGHLALNLDNPITLIEGSLPHEVNLTLNQSRFDAIRKWLHPTSNPESLTLVEPAKVKAKITHLDFPLGHLWDSGLKANLNIALLHVRDNERNQEIEIRDLHANFDTEKISKRVAFRIGSEKVDHNAQFVLDGTFSHGFHPDGNLNFEGMSLQVVGQAEKLPAALFCRTITPNPELANKIEAIVGEKLDANIQVNLTRMQGPVNATLKGSHGTLDLDAQVSNGVLKLLKPLTTSITASPALGKHVLSEFMPFLSELTSSDKPITVSIPAEGFEFPLRNFDVSRIKIPSGTIILGKLQFSNSGELEEIISLLKPIRSSTVNVWFTPLYFSMSNGSLDVSRIDLLVGDLYPIATWGKVNVVKNKAKMELGVSGKALKMVTPNLKVKDDSMVTFPIDQKGIDHKKAALKIASLVAKSQGTKEGAIIGTLLELTNPQSKVPPPTTSPFPWEGKL